MHILSGEYFIDDWLLHVHECTRICSVNTLVARSTTAISALLCRWREYQPRREGFHRRSWTALTSYPVTFSFSGKTFCDSASLPALPACCLPPRQWWCHALLCCQAIIWQNQAPNLSLSSLLPALPAPPAIRVMTIRHDSQFKTFCCEVSHNNTYKLRRLNAYCTCYNCMLVKYVQ